MTPIEEIQSAAKKYAESREALTEIVAVVNQQLQLVYAEHMKDIRKAVGAVAERGAPLRALIEAHPELFEKPRTQVFHGIKVGFRKGTGGFDWEDESRVVALIKKHFPELADVLILVTEKPSKEGLETIDVSDLKRIGVTVENTGDVVVIKPTDSNVDKTVKALLKNSPEEAA